MYNYTYMCGYSPQLVTTWGHGTHGRLQLCFQPIEVHPGCAAPILPALPAGISCTTPSNVASWLFKFPSLPWHLAQGAVQNEAPAILLSISPAPKNIRGISALVERMATNFLESGAQKAAKQSSDSTQSCIWFPSRTHGTVHWWQVSHLCCTPVTSQPPDFEIKIPSLQS